MSQLQPYSPSTGVQLRVQRQLTRLTTDTGLATAHLDARAEVEAVRASAVAAVGQRAMQEVALLTKLERDLSETVPAAVARLTTIGDLTSIALGDVVLQAARRIGRA
jgi:hypothetical protein